ncbi:MAG: hypothetical protein EA425_02110 [Puniceicoccaceae bacterium]|nr:MAG: hypothetical protein EA425_02110 [Puniceicoccaceae bacterium]
MPSLYPIEVARAAESVVRNALGERGQPGVLEATRIIGGRENEVILYFRESHGGQKPPLLVFSVKAVSGGTANSFHFSRLVPAHKHAHTLLLVDIDAAELSETIQAFLNPALELVRPKRSLPATVAGDAAAQSPDGEDGEEAAVATVPPDETEPGLN